MRDPTQKNPGEVMSAWREHWRTYAEVFAQPLQANSLLSRFVTEPNVTGAYAEAWIRATAKNMLSQRYRISTGAVIRPTDSYRGLDSVCQCDLIIWDPSELPGLFEYGEFALVPFAAARAIIEIKRTLSTPNKLLDQLRERRRLLEQRQQILGVVVAHPSPLFDRECDPDWLSQHSSVPAMTRLLDKDNQPDTDGIMAFIYFLAQIAGHHRVVL
ncbi:MAG: DUF6602 domain-containing protein [Pyrinomonadaceae bacterium]